MMKNHRFSLFSLSFCFLFASLKITYSCQNLSSQKTKSLDIKEGSRSCRIREGGEKSSGEEKGGSGIFLDLFWQLLRIYQSFFILLWARFKKIFSLP